MSPDGLLQRALALLIFCLIIAPTAATAQSNDSDQNKIDTLAKNILLDEIHLQEINARLSIQAATPSFKRGRRTWLWDYGNALTTESGLIAATALYYSHYVYRKNNHIPNSQIAATIYPQIVGQVIGGAGSMVELSLDLKKAIKLHREKLNVRAVTREARLLDDRIEKSLQRYSQLAGSDRLYLSEGAVLQDIHNHCLGEFVRIEKRAALLSSSQLTEDIFSFTRNTVGCVGNCLNVAAILNSNKRLNGQADILNLVAASMVTTRPFVSNLTGLITTKIRQDRLRRTFSDLDGGAEPGNEKLESDLTALHSIAIDTTGDARGETVTPILQRLKIYDSQMQRCREQASENKTEKEKARQLVTRRFRESIYGPTKLAQSTLGIIVGLRSQQNATKDYQMGAAANCTYTAGQLFNIVELTRERIVDEKSHARDQQLGHLPEQQVKRTSEALAEMRQELESPAR